MRRIGLIISCRKASCYILWIYFSSSEITACSINNQTCDKTKKSILSVEIIYERGNLFKKNAKAGVRTRVMRDWAYVRTVCLHRKSRDTTREIYCRISELYGTWKIIVKLKKNPSEAIFVFNSIDIRSCQGRTFTLIGICCVNCTWVKIFGADTP